MFTIKITEQDLTVSPPHDIERLVLTVDTLDIQAVFAAVTKKPRAVRKDAGKPREPKADK